MLNIRKAGFNDIKLIRSLAEQIWPATYEKILTADQIEYMMNMMYSEESLHEQMESKDFILMYDEETPVGFASYSEVEPNIYKLHKIYLLQNLRGKGAGRFMLEYVINDVKKKGANALQLNVNIHNPAKGFYEKLGFSVIKREDIDIGSAFFMNDYVMEKKITEQNKKQT